MSTATIVLLVLAAGTYALKAAGPLLLGSRQLLAPVESVIALLPAPLLAALVVTSTVADGRVLAVDARIAGVAVAGLLLWRGAGFIVVILGAAASTALIRLLV